MTTVNNVKSEDDILCRAIVVFQMNFRPKIKENEGM